MRYNIINLRYAGKNYMEVLAMAERIRKITIMGTNGEIQTIDFGQDMPFTLEKGILTVNKSVQIPVVTEEHDYEAIITSKGFVITKYVNGQRIEFYDPNTANCFVAKLGINSVDPISWYGETLDEAHWHDPNTTEIQQKRDFVKKYGMIVVPQYCLSYENGELKSIAGKKPFVNRNWQDSYNMFSTMKLPEGVSISMIAGFEIDRSLQHIIDTKEGTFDDITKDSKLFGGYDADEVYETGREGTPCIDGVYNQTGLVRFWTQQMFADAYRVLQSGSCRNGSNVDTAANRNNLYPSSSYSIWSSTGTLSW